MNKKPGTVPLSALSEGYREAAVELRLAVERAEERAKAGDRRAARELGVLRQMLSQARDLRALTRDYYRRPRSPRYTVAGMQTKKK